MVGRKTSRSAGDARGVTFSGKASLNILTIRDVANRRAQLQIDDNLSRHTWKTIMLKGLTLKPPLSVETGE